MRLNSMGKALRGQSLFALLAVVLVGGTLTAVDAHAGRWRTIPIFGQCGQTGTQVLPGAWLCPFVSDPSLSGPEIQSVFLDFELREMGSAADNKVTGSACRMTYTGTVTCKNHVTVTGPGTYEILLKRGFSNLGPHAPWDFYYVQLALNKTWQRNAVKWIGISGTDEVW